MTNVDLEIAISRFRSALAAEAALEKFANFIAAYKANFDPNQPRVPAGNSDGGQWTSIDSPSSETNVEVVSTGPAYAATEISIDASGLTGISTIDETTIALAKTLAKVVDGLGIIPGMDAGRYGTLVHGVFATAVRLGNFRGIGPSDVETTFSLDPDAHYGSKGSIRTDVILRNDVGDIIAIYDVKTGTRGLSRSRGAELRAKTRTGPSVPIIELNLLRGVQLKYASVPALVSAGGWIFDR